MTPPSNVCIHRPSQPTNNTRCFSTPPHLCMEFGCKIVGSLFTGCMYYEHTSQRIETIQENRLVNCEFLKWTNEAAYSQKNNLLDRKNEYRNAIPPILHFGTYCILLNRCILMDCIYVFIGGSDWEDIPIFLHLLSFQSPFIYNKIEIKPYKIIIAML